MAVGDKDKRARGLLPTADMAELLDMNSQALGRLKRDGVLIGAESGWYDVKATIRNYIRHLRQRASNGQDAADLNEEYLREKVAKTRADRKRSELEYSKELGRVIALDVANSDGRRVGALVNAGVYGMVGKLPPVLAGLGPVEVEARLREAADELLGALATGAAVYPDELEEPGDKAPPVGVVERVQAAGKAPKNRAAKKKAPAKKAPAKKKRGVRK